MIAEELKEVKITIKRVILEKTRPFKLSDLYEDLSKEGITDTSLILDVLSELYERGLIDRTEVEDDVWGYKSVY